MKKKISVILILVVFFTMFLGNYSKAESQLIKVSLADNQSSEVKSGEKVYLKVETKESVSDVELSFDFIGENVQGYRTFSANIQDINTKPYIVIPEIENELYGKCVLDTIVMKDAAGNRKIYTNHQGGADGFINDEDVIKLVVSKAESKYNTEIIKVSLAENQSSNVKIGEKVYLKVEAKESVADVNLTFYFIGNNINGYRTFSANIQDINTKPYIIIPKVEEELYGECLLDTMVIQDTAGKQKIYTNHQGGADGFIKDEDVIKLTVAKQTKTDNTTEKTDNTTAKIENTTTKTDNTTANKKIPKAGKSTVLLIILALIIINCAGLYIHKKIR